MRIEASGWPRRAIREQVDRRPGEQPWLGPVGHLVLLLWSLALVLLVPPERTLLAAAIILIAGATLQRLPGAGQQKRQAPAGRGRRRTRLLLLLGLIIVPALIAAVDVGPDGQLQAVSWAALGDALRMVVRAGVIMVAVSTFTAAVSISEIAALFERAGVRGLGFALGVAMNLLPLLQQSISSTWHSMRMRGGFRRRRLQHLRLFLTTLICTTLCRAETIALAAETRAYSPDKSCPVPLARGRLDAILAVAGSGLILLLLLY